MKAKCLLCVFLSLAVYSSGTRFSAINSQGIELWYSTLTDSTVMLTGSISNLNTDGDSLNYAYITSDTIIVPEIVYNQTKEYKVIQLNPYGVFNFISSLTTLYLPKTIKLIGDSMVYSELSKEYAISAYQYINEVGDFSMIDCNFAFTGSPNLKNIYIDSGNPYYTSIDGVVYTKDLKTLIAYGQGRQEEYFSPPEGCEHIGRMAIYANPYLVEIEMPNSLRSIGNQSMYSLKKLERLMLKDSVEQVGYKAVFTRRTIQSLHLGKALKNIGGNGSSALPKSRYIYCYASIPPQGAPYYSGNEILYVPRQSLSAYQQAEGWKNFGTILPIEPPIVVGVDTAEVSWVQNFSATGYVWTLYTDEAKTQRFMSLTFDANGHLTHIDINPDHMPARMPALYSENGEEEKRFAEYYSFTISGLSPETTYYYTRQSLKGTEVIDEETGSFETQSNEATGLNGYESVTPTPQKFIENGQVYINDGNVTYNVEGAIIGK